MLDFQEYLNQSAGIAAQKQQEVAAQASSKKASISGQPNMAKVSAAISNPELLGGLTEQERDLATLNAAQMFDKYGSQALDGNAGLLDAAKQRDIDIGATRTTPEIIGDTAIGVGQGVANFLGGTAAMATIPFDDSLNTNIGGSISEGMDWLNEAANNLKSDGLTGQNRIVETNKQLLETINDQQYEQDKAEGAGIEADLSRMGRGFMNTAGEIFDNPAVLGDVTAQGIGSVIPTGATAKGLQVGINLFKSAAEKIALKEAKDAVKAGTATAAQKALLQPSELATSGMIGVSTAGGAYNQTYSSAMKELSTREDLSQEEKEDMANKAARTAALITLPSAIAAGKLVSKFEANPLAYGGAKAAALNVLKEPAEETLQEGKSKFAENVALSQEIDPNRSFSKGVGESGGEGAVGGLGTATVLSGPGAAVGVAGKVAVGAAKAANTFIGKREAAAEAKAEDETTNAIQTAKTNLESIKEKIASSEVMNASEKDLITPAIDEIAAVGKPATFTPTPTSTDTDAATPKTKEELNAEINSVVEEAKTVLNTPPATIEPTEQTTSEDEEEAKANSIIDRAFHSAGNNPTLLVNTLGKFIALAPKGESKLAAKATAELLITVANQQSLIERYNNQDMPDNEETAYIKSVAEGFKKLQNNEKFKENYELAKKRLLDEINSDRDFNPVEAEAYAKAAIANPTLVTKENIDKLIRNMAPLVTSDPERAKTTVDSLKLLQGAVDVLSSTAGKTSVSDAQAKSESNVANQSDGVFKSLQNYVSDFVNQTDKKQDTTKTLSSLARFAQGQLNKLAAMDYSKEVSTTTRGRAPEIKPLTFSYTNEEFVETYGKGVFSLSDALKNKPAWKTSNEQHNRIKLEAETALGLYDYFNSQLPEGSRLPSLVQKGGIWKPDGTQELEFKPNDAGVYSQVAKEAIVTPPAIVTPTPPAAVTGDNEISLAKITAVEDQLNLYENNVPTDEKEIGTSLNNIKEYLKEVRSIRDETKDEGIKNKAREVFNRLYIFGNKLSGNDVRESSKQLDKKLESFEPKTKVDMKPFVDSVKNFFTTPKDQNSGLAKPIVMLARKIGYKQAALLALDIYSSTNRTKGKQATEDLNEFRENSLLEALKTEDEEFASVYKHYKDKFKGREIDTEADTNPSNIVTDGDGELFKEVVYYSQMFAMQTGRVDKELNEVNLETIKNAEYVTENGEEYLKFDSKKYFKNFISAVESSLTSNKDKTQLEIMKLVLELLPKNHSTRLGVTRNPYSNSKMNSVTLTSRAQTGNYFSNETLFHEYFHAATVGHEDEAYIRDLNEVKVLLKNYTKSDEYLKATTVLATDEEAVKNAKARLKSDIDYALSDTNNAKNEELGAVLASSLNVIKALREYSVAKKDPNLKGMTNLTSILRKLYKAVAEYLGGQFDGEILQEEIDKAITIDRIFRGAFENYHSRRTLVTPLATPPATPPSTLDPIAAINAEVEEESTSEATKELIKTKIGEVISSLGSGVEGVVDVIKSWIKVSQGKTNILQTIFTEKIEDSLKELQSKIPVAEEGTPQIDLVRDFKFVRDVIKNRASNFSTQKAYKTFKTRLETVKDQGVLKIYDQDFAAVWLNSNGELDDKLLDMLALSSIIWMHSGNAKGQFSSSFIASALNDVATADKVGLKSIKGEEDKHKKASERVFSNPKMKENPVSIYDKDNVPKNVYYAMQKFFPAEQATASLAQVFKQISGISVSDTAGVIATQGIVDVFGPIMLNGLNDARLIERHSIDLNSNKKVVSTKLNVEESISSEIGYVLGLTFQEGHDTNGKLSKIFEEHFKESLGSTQLYYTTEDTKPIPVDNTQIRSKVQLSKEQKIAIEAANNIVYTANKQIGGIYTTLGLDGLDYLFGSGLGSDFDKLQKSGNVNEEHFRSLEGKRLSVVTDVEAIQEYLKGAENKDENFGYKFAHAISKVFRLQQQGNLSTPQGSKIIRSLLSPNRTTLDFSNSKHEEVFRRALAQAWGIKVAEKKNWDDLLNQEINSSNFKKALEAVAKLEKGEQPSKADLDVLKHYTEEGSVGLLALTDYVKYQEAKKGKDTKAQIHLPIEADGKTNGPAAVIYMLVTEFNADWFTNMNRVGIDIGADKGKSLREIYNTGDKVLDDVYTNVGKISEESIGKLDLTTAEYSRAKAKINSLSGGTVSEALYNEVHKVRNFAAKFIMTRQGEKLFSIDKTNGTIVIGRGLVKNPITVTLYGASETSIANKITSAILDVIYASITEALSDPNVDIDNLVGDINGFVALASDAALDTRVKRRGENVSSFYVFKDGSDQVKRNLIDTDETTDKKIEALKKFSFNSTAFEALSNGINQSIVKTGIAPAIEKGVGADALESTKDMIMFSNILGVAAKTQFDKRVAEIVDKNREAYLESITDKTEKANKTLTNRPDEYFITKAEMDKIYQETYGVNPAIDLLFGSISLGSTEKSSGNTVASGFTSVKYKGYNAQSFGVGVNTIQVGNPGVKILPYTVISSGDASTIIGSFVQYPELMAEILAVFDGINLTLDKAINTNEAINTANIKAWNENIYAKMSDVLTKAKENALSAIDSMGYEELIAQEKLLVSIDSEKYSSSFFKDIKSGQKSMSEEEKYIFSMDASEAIKAKLHFMNASFQRKARLVEAKLKVIEKLGLSSDQFSSVEAPYFSKGTAEASDFSKLTPEAKAAKFKEMLVDELQGISSSVQTKEGMKVVDYLKDLVSNKLANVEDRRTAKSLLALLPENSNLEIKKSKKHSKDKINSTRTVYVKDSSDPNSTKEILAHTMDAIIANKIHSWVLSSQKVNKGLIGNYAKDLGFTRLEKVLTNLDKLEISALLNTSSAVALNGLIKDIKTTLGTIENQEDLFDGKVTLEEAYNKAVERMNYYLNQGTKEGKEEASIEASRITQALSKLIRETVSNPDIRNILGTVTASNSTPREVVKSFVKAKRDVAALIDSDPKRVKETLRIIGQLIRGIINSIFGDQLGKKLFSIKEDIEFSTQLFTFVPSDVRGSPETDPLKKRLWDKKGNAIINDGSSMQKKKTNNSVNYSAPPIVGSDQGRPAAAVQFMDMVVDTLPKLAELNETELVKATVVAAEIAAGLPAALNKAGFNLTTDQSQDVVTSTLMFATVLDHNPTVVEQIRRIYDQFVSKVTDKDLSKSEIDYLRLSAFKEFKDLKGNSLALPIFASLVQASPEFANTVDKVVEPSKEATFKFTGINEFLTHQQEKLSNVLLKFQGVDVKGLNTSDSLKLLYSHLENESEKNSILYELGTTHEKLISRVDDIGADALQKLAQTLEGVNTSISAVDKTAKTVGTLLNKDNHAAIARMATSVGNLKKMPDIFRSLIRDVFSHDNHIEALTTLNKRVKNVFQSIRQGTRERVPVELAKAFSRKLNQEEWKTLTDTVAKLDFGVFNSKDAIKYVKSNSALTSEIASIEASLGQEPHWANVRTKALQLANYMATGIAGVELRPNAIAVGELISNGTKYERSKEYNTKLDQLISLYAIERMNKEQKNDFLSLVQSEESGVTNLIDYANGIRQQEKMNSNSLTKYNERKGYIPQRLEEGSSIKVLPQSVGKDLIKRGYKEIAPYRGHGADSLYYYYAPVSGMNAFIQGVSQNIRPSANGIDALTGFPRGTINGGIIKDNKTVQALVHNFPTAQANKIEGFIPIYNADGRVIAFERTVDLSKIEDAVFETNLAKLMGIQLGRQYEELGTKEINTELVKLTYRQWKDPVEQDKKSEYVNILDETQLTRTQQDAVSLVPKELKDSAQELFGKNTWMVRRDAIDIAFGYRQPGLGDFITGVSNWSPETQKEVLRIMNTVLGAKGIAMALKGEEFYKNVIKDAKLLIVVKSVTVSALNLFYNTTQLMANGVKLADISKKVPKILNESVLLSDSIKQETVLRAELVKLYNNGEEFNRAVARISALVEARKKLSIYHLYERGEFGSIEDVGDASDLRSIAEGDFLSKIQEKVEQLPPLARDTVKNLYMTKDSAVFQFLQKSVEYGDFIAKALLFDKLSAELDKDDPEYKMKLEAAYNQVKTEFVDYDLIQGRNRAWTDSMGILWFWNYALRTTKSATRLMFSHPFRSIMHSLTPLDTPLKENVFAKLLDGSISSSMGLSMLWRSPGLHPIVNAM